MGSQMFYYGEVLNGIKSKLVMAVTYHGYTWDIINFFLKHVRITGPFFQIMDNLAEFTFMS